MVNIYLRAFARLSIILNYNGVVKVIFLPRVLLSSTEYFLK